MKREGARPKAAVVGDKALRRRHGEAGIVGNYFHGGEAQSVRLCTFCNHRSFHIDRLRLVRGREPGLLVLAGN